MILFLPFRSLEDLKIDDSYQKAFQKAHKNGKFSKNMIDKTENIQTIHNSLASSILENALTAKTCLTEDFSFELTDEEDNDDYENMLAGIGELFLTLTTGNNLKEDLKLLDLKFGNQFDSHQIETTS